MSAEDLIPVIEWTLLPGGRLLATAFYHPLRPEKPLWMFTSSRVVESTGDPDRPKRGDVLTTSSGSRYLLE